MAGILGLVEEDLEGWKQSPGILDMFVVKGHPLLVVCNGWTSETEDGPAAKENKQQTYLAVLVDVLLLQFAHRSREKLIIFTRKSQTVSSAPTCC